MKHLRDLTIKDMATLSGVSVRTLQYYDQIGLLPAQRLTSGYRIYTQDDVLLLQQILVRKSLGLSLKAIQDALHAPDFDVVAQLKEQKQLLAKRAEDTRVMMAAVDLAIAKASALDTETVQSIQSLFEGFDPSLYEEETEAKWGATERFKTSRWRTKSYTSDDWSKIKAEETAIWEEAAELMGSGYTSQSNQAGKLAERHRHHIEKWYYETTEEGYAALADLWESDPRFTVNIDKYATGLTEWFAEAVRHKYLMV